MVWSNKGGGTAISAAQQFSNRKYYEPGRRDSFISIKNSRWLHVFDRAGTKAASDCKIRRQPIAKTASEDARACKTRYVGLELDGAAAYIVFIRHAAPAPA